MGIGAIITIVVYTALHISFIFIACLLELFLVVHTFRLWRVFPSDQRRVEEESYRQADRLIECMARRIPQSISYLFPYPPLDSSFTPSFPDATSPFLPSPSHYPILPLNNEKFPEWSPALEPLEILCPSASTPLSLGESAREHSPSFPSIRTEKTMTMGMGDTEDGAPATNPSAAAVEDMPCGGGKNDSSEGKEKSSLLWCSSPPSTLLSVGTGRCCSFSTAPRFVCSSPTRKKEDEDQVKESRGRRNFGSYSAAISTGDLMESAFPKSASGILAKPTVSSLPPISALHNSFPSAFLDSEKERTEMKDEEFHPCSSPGALTQKKEYCTTAEKVGSSSTSSPIRCSSFLLELSLQKTLSIDRIVHEAEEMGIKSRSQPFLQPSTARCSAENG